MLLSKRPRMQPSSTIACSFPIKRATQADLVAPILSLTAMTERKMRPREVQRLTNGFSKKFEAHVSAVASGPYKRKVSAT